MAFLAGGDAKKESLTPNEKLSRDLIETYGA